jgi:hypothetical protein
MARPKRQYIPRWILPPTPAKELLAEFWKLEKEAEKMLEGPRVQQSMNPSTTAEQVWR